MKILTKRQILLLHTALIGQSGGSDGIRDAGLLDSAIHAPFQTFADQELYPSLLEKAARLGFGLICNHPFVDGNKRIGTHAMLVFLDINQISLNYEDKDLIETILAVASGTLDYNGLLSWLQCHIEKLTKKGTLCFSFCEAQRSFLRVEKLTRSGWRGRSS